MTSSACDDHGHRFDPLALYNLTSDPWQAVNLAEHAPETTARLAAMMDDSMAARLSAPTACGADPWQQLLALRAG